MKPVKFGVIGLGGMGRSHVRKMSEIAEIELVGIADMNEEATKAVSEEYNVSGYHSHIELLEKSGAEAVLVAVPHPFHAAIAIDAAKRGIHVLSEKPVAVTVSEADAMVEACDRAGVLLGVMFQRRLDVKLEKAKEILDSGTLGDLYEVEMISTNWYRLQSYYDGGAWRGTWKGEGGGILANQTPHNLDLLAWLAGMPQSVNASVLTRIHRIETENTVHAIMNYPTGMTGYFRATTSDPIGEDRIEFHGSKGRLIYTRKSLQLCRYKVPVPTHIMESKTRTFEVDWEDIPAEGGTGDHGEVSRRFARAVRLGEPPVATGVDGVKALELANAMHLSGLRQKQVSLPLDREEVDQLFDDLREGKLSCPKS